MSSGIILRKFGKPTVERDRAGGVEVIDTKRTGLRMIEGIASTPSIASNNISLSMAGAKFDMPIPLLSGHGREIGERKGLPHRPKEISIGEVVRIERSEGWIRIRAVLDDHEGARAAWRLIEQGATLTLSVLAGEQTTRAVVDGVKYYSSWRMKEVSVVREPANPDCRCWIYRP